VYINKQLISFFQYCFGIDLDFARNRINIFFFPITNVSDVSAGNLTLGMGQLTARELQVEHTFPNLNVPLMFPSCDHPSNI
jgi:hypothetical protein